MRPELQKQFVKELLREIEKHAVAAIDDHSIPPDWDGLELRELVFDKAREARGFRFGRNGNVNPNSKRVTEYRSLVLTHNL